MNAVHEITIDKQGNQIGTDGQITVSLIGDGRMFKRRAIKGVGSGNSEEVCWLVAEMDGVRVYHQGSSVIVTKNDMNP
ncbi:MAG: hypothetical protein IPL15_11760 [Comamonadaceae bacterium]|uniref:hypothetical protein n=1 Tax=Candidatus Skiveiella danica TaxID=3386177 RepID=UPI00390944E8|nr:hypothetical protein [Comamonadaceae bacterium]